MPETTTDAAPAAPDPADRARPDITGTPVVLADGRTWVLADGIPDLSALAWDALYEDNRIRGEYDAPDIAVAACHLLRANYDVTLPEAFGLVAGSDVAGLVPAVEKALFGVGTSAGTFSDWAVTSLWSNGIDPARVPPRLLWPILNQLVAMGRAPAPADAIRAERKALENAKVQAFIAAARPGPVASPPGP